ncbi:unnamed protein product, partial [marine sediment metagenome]
FLGEPHTRKFMRKELYIPTMIDRNRRSTWRKKGSKDIIERARDKVKQILQSFTPPEVDGEIEAKLKDYIKDVEKRSLDQYKNAEGISAGNVSLPGGDVIIEDK